MPTPLRDPELESLVEQLNRALTAAETGHLILSTLHTNDVAQAIHRMVDVFPPAAQSQIRHQLALCVHAIVSQQLLPRADGRGRVPAVEVMRATYRCASTSAGRPCRSSTTRSPPGNATA